MFEGKVLLITRGTGSFGDQVLNGFLPTDVAEIRIFSRDEKKQGNYAANSTTKWSSLWSARYATATAYLNQCVA